MVRNAPDSARPARVPLYRTIADAIIRDIRRGRHLEGERLPAPLSRVLGNPGLATILVLATITIAVVNTALAVRIDRLCTRAMSSVYPDFEAEANRLMLRQAGTTVIHAVVVSLILLAAGGMP